MNNAYMIGALVVIVIATFLLLAAVFGKGGIIKSGVVSIDIKSDDSKQLGKTSRAVLGAASAAGYLVGVLLIVFALPNGDGSDDAGAPTPPASPTRSEVNATVNDQLDPEDEISEHVALQIEGLPVIEFTIDEANPDYSLPVTFPQAVPYAYEIAVVYVDLEENSHECTGSGTVNVSQDAAFNVEWTVDGQSCVAQLTAR